MASLAISAWQDAAPVHQPALRGVVRLVHAVVTPADLPMRSSCLFVPELLSSPLIRVLMPHLTRLRVGSSEPLASRSLVPSWENFFDNSARLNEQVRAAKYPLGICR